MFRSQQIEQLEAQLAQERESLERDKERERELRMDSLPVSSDTALAHYKQQVVAARIKQNALAEELAALKKGQFVDHTPELQHLRTELELAQDEIRKLKTIIKSKDEECVLLRQHASTMQLDAKTVEDSVRQKEVRIAEYNEDLTNARAARMVIENENKQLKLEDLRKEEIIAKLHIELCTQQALDKLEKDRSESCLNETIHRLQGEIKNLNSVIDASRNEITESKLKINEVERLVAQLREQNRKNQDSAERFQLENAKLQRMVDRLHESEVELQTKYRKTQLVDKAEITALANELKRLESADRERSKFKREVQDLKVWAEALEERIKESDGQDVCVVRKRLADNGAPLSPVDIRKAFFEEGPPTKATVRSLVNTYRTQCTELLNQVLKEVGEDDL